MAGAIIKKGITTIVWGTGGLWPTPSAVIAESITKKNKVDVPAVENGDGFTSTEVIINDGYDYEMKAVYDSALTWPVVGDAVTVKSVNDATGKAGYVTSISDEAQRKKEGMVTIEAHFRVNI